MGSLIDVITSIAIGGAVIAIIVGLSLYISSSSREHIGSNLTQSNARSLGEVVENDFYKIGYRIQGQRIAIADSTQVKFYADMDNDGTKDSVRYFLGNDDIPNTPNPKDRLLYRVYNSETPNSSNLGVVAFRLSYFDSLGQKLLPIPLTTAQRQSIRSIGVYIRVESPNAEEGYYQGTEWQKIIRFKNVR
jgi:hypothetical protein